MTPIMQGIRATELLGRLDGEGARTRAREVEPQAWVLRLDVQRPAARRTAP